MIREETKALLVLILVVVVMGFCGWYENYEPGPVAADPVKQFGVDAVQLQARRDSQTLP